MTDGMPAAATLSFTVTEEDTAAAVGSGDLAVLGTPRLLAWAEAATRAAVAEELDGSSTSVGTRVTFEHRAASAVGEEVRVTASVVHRDGRLLRFEVVAVDSSDNVVGYGEVTRVIVDRRRFMDRLRRTD
jgi:predicted thioesterase